jgi:hypothetical protein
MRLSTLSIACLFVTLLSSTASAQPDGAGGQTHIQTVRIDVHATIGWWWALGLGARADIPIVADGFVESLDDEFAISAGIDVAFVSWRYDQRCDGYGCWNDWSVWFPVLAQWNVYLSPEWSVFPELGGAFVLYDCGPPGFTGVCASGSPLISFGARWHFSPPRMSLLLRAAYPFGVQVGITF